MKLLLSMYLMIVCLIMRNSRVYVNQEVIDDSFTMPPENMVSPRGTIVMRPLYSVEQGSKHIDAILESYYEGKKVPGQTEYQRLREILRTIRALHTMHPKLDSNWRVN